MMEFRLILRGAFHYGSKFDADAYEGEPTELEPFDLIYDFEMAKYPITVRQFSEFLGDDGYVTDKWWTTEGRKWRDQVKRKAPNLWEEQVQNMNAKLPIQGVSFFEATAYTKWYTSQRADSYLYRLPTETEWEKAARGAIILNNGEINPKRRRIFPWGDTFNIMYANTSERGLNRVIAVDDHPQEASSLYDICGLSGNLFEWCINTPENYPSNDIDLDEGRPFRVARGGSYVGNYRDARCSARFTFRPNSQLFFTVRLVRVSQQER